MIGISEFAKLCGTTVKTIRFYDKRGVLKPAYISKETGYRYYRRSSVSEYYKIVFMKEAGFSLKEINDHLYHMSMDDILMVLNEKVTSLSNQIKKCQELKEELNNMKAQTDRYAIMVDQSGAKFQILNVSRSLSCTVIPRYQEEYAAIVLKLLNENMEPEQQTMFQIGFDDIFEFTNGKTMCGWQTFYIKKHELTQSAEILIYREFQEASHLIISIESSPDISLESVEYVIQNILSHIDDTSSIAVGMNFDSTEEGVFVTLIGFKG